jgi:hypothetical protein
MRQRARRAERVRSALCRVARSDRLVVAAASPHDQRNLIHTLHQLAATLLPSHRVCQHSTEDGVDVTGNACADMKKQSSTENEGIDMNLSLRLTSCSLHQSFIDSIPCTWYCCPLNPTNCGSPDTLPPAMTNVTGANW